METPKKSGVLPRDRARRRHYRCLLTRTEFRHVPLQRAAHQNVTPLARPVEGGGRNVRAGGSTDLIPAPARPSIIAWHCSDKLAYRRQMAWTATTTWLRGAKLKNFSVSSVMAFSSSA